VVEEYCADPFKYADKYNLDERMAKASIVPHKYLHRRLPAAPAFKNHPRGAGYAINQAIRTLIDCGELVDVSASEMSSLFQTKAKAYRRIGSVGLTGSNREVDLVTAGTPLANRALI
jgi:hypothetical protein